MIDNNFQPPEDDGSGKPGTVRRKPGGRFYAIRIAKPAAWLVVGVTSGDTQWIAIRDERVADIHTWPGL